jgi:hypothetical protein
MSKSRPFLKAFAVAGAAAFVLTLLPVLWGGWSFDRATGPWVIGGCLVAGLITGSREYLSKQDWPWRRVFVVCVSTILWMTFAMICVLLVNGR